MGVKMVMPGVYHFEPGTDDDDSDKYARMVKFSNIDESMGKRMRLSSFENIPGRDRALEAAMAFIRGEVDPPLFLLYGEPGRSKTHLAIAIGMAFLALLKSVIYYHVGDLLDDLREGLKINQGLSPGEFSPKSSEAIIGRCKGYDLLILDDLGLENPTFWASEKLDTVVNHRYEKRLPTVLTANTLEISDRILDRCRHGLVVRIEGESYRGILAKRKGSNAKEDGP